VAVDGRTVRHGHPSGDDVTGDPALRLELHPVGGLDVAFDVTLDGDFLGADRRLAGGAAGDVHFALPGDRALELTHDLRLGLEEEVTLQRGVGTDDCSGFLAGLGHAMLLLLVWITPPFCAVIHATAGGIEGGHATQSRVFVEDMHRRSSRKTPSCP
jgi:hypothetical protein